MSAADTLKDTGWRWDKDENNDGRGDLKKIHWMHKGNKSYFRRVITVGNGLFLSYHTSNDPAFLKLGQKYFPTGRAFSSLGMAGNDGWHCNARINLSSGTRPLELQEAIKLKDELK